MSAIHTAEEVALSIDRHRKQQSRERREWERQRDALEYYGDLRDDVMSLVKNSGMSYEDINAACGPCVATLTAWAEKKIAAPRLGKLQSVLRILGYDLGVVEGRRRK